MVIIVKIDTGDGYYDIEKGSIMTYDGQFKRIPNEEEEEWIKTKCKYNPRIIEMDNYNNDEFSGEKDEVISNIIREFKFKSVGN